MTRPSPTRRYECNPAPACLCSLVLAPEERFGRLFPSWQDQNKKKMFEMVQFTILFHTFSPLMIFFVEVYKNENGRQNLSYAKTGLQMPSYTRTVGVRRGPSYQFLIFYSFVVKYLSYVDNYNNVNGYIMFQSQYCNIKQIKLKPRFLGIIYSRNIGGVIVGKKYQ